MNTAAPHILVALENSGFGLAIRQSVWLYPLANIAHVLAIVSFSAAVAVMDFALLGLLGERNLELARRARRVVIALFVVALATGLVLFVAEASHIAMNRVFQLKMLFVVLALVNALLLGRMALADASPSSTPETHLAAKVAAVLSLTTWLSVAGLGRLIAYF